MFTQTVICYIQLSLFVLLTLTSCNHADKGEKDSSNECRDKSKVLDDMAADSIKEMLGKLEGVLSQHTSLHKAYSSSPCYDMTSGRAVVTQICDKIASLETRLDKSLICHLPPAPKANGHSKIPEKVKEVTDSPPKPKGVADPECSKNNDITIEDSSMTMSDVKSELEKLKRSTSFYARSLESLPNNVTHHKLGGFNASLNKGINFDITSGEFKAPYEGIYHFSLGFLKGKKFPLEACLVVDDIVIARARDEEQAYIDLMTSLATGQRVWADVTTTNVPQDSEVTLTFSGFFVH